MVVLELSLATNSVFPTPATTNASPLSLPRRRRTHYRGGTLRRRPALWLRNASGGRGRASGGRGSSWRGARKECHAERSPSTRGFRRRFAARATTGTRARYAIRSVLLPVPFNPSWRAAATPCSPRSRGAASAGRGPPSSIATHTSDIARATSRTRRWRTSRRTSRELWRRPPRNRIATPSATQISTAPTAEAGAATP